LLLFGISGKVYGCAIDIVREIIPFRHTTRLPGAPPYVCGLINLRGTIVTVIDLGLRLAGTPVDRTLGSVILVEHGAKIVGLGVDELRDVQTVTDAQVEAGGGAAVEGASGLVAGLAHMNDGVVVMLDVQTIVRQVLL
jgi:purine-binding chemotaxis protein CheW